MPFAELINQFKEFNLTAKSLYNFKSNRVEIIKSFESATKARVKSLKKGKYPELEELLKFISNAIIKSVGERNIY